MVVMLWRFALRICKKIKIRFADRFVRIRKSEPSSERMASSAAEASLARAAASRSSATEFSRWDMESSGLTMLRTRELAYSAR